MKFIAYIFSIAFFRVLSILPRFIIYFFSDLVYLLLYYVVGYGKKVVIKNITNSFPEYSREQIMKMTRKFYRHLADLLLESTASLYYPQKRLKKMVQYTNRR